MVKNGYFFSLIIILLNSIKFSFSHIYPVKKIIFSNNIKDLYKAKNIQINFESKGYGIIFNDKSNISLIPYNLFLDIYTYFSSNEDIGLKIKKHENGLEEILINAFVEGDNFETTHFILENFGISIPAKYFLVTIEEHQIYGIRFLSKENQEFIEFGKDLIDIMNIEFKDEKNFIINNKEFITKLED